MSRRPILHRTRARIGYTCGSETEEKAGKRSGEFGKTGGGEGKPPKTSSCLLLPLMCCCHPRRLCPPVCPIVVASSLYVTTTVAATASAVTTTNGRSVFLLLSPALEATVEARPFRSTPADIPWGTRRWK